MIGIINWLKGYLRIRVMGVTVERFINLCGFRNILLWNVCKNDDSHEMFISLSAFKELRPIVRKTKTKVVILKRYGLPFFVSSLNKRKIFLLGCMFSVFFWQISGNFIWQINIEGNYRITNEQLYDYLEENNIHIGMWKNRLNIEQLEKELRITFPDISWTSGKVEGTAFLLQVKEADGISVQETFEDSSQYDLVAQADGEVEKIIVRQGIPLVKQGDIVTKDMILVEGKIPIMNDDGTLKENNYVKSDADIYIKYNIEYEESIPLKYTKKSYTGRIKEIPYFRLSEKELKMQTSPKFLNCDMILQENTFQIIKDLNIPIKWGTYVFREYQNMEVLYEENEACNVLEEKLLQFLNSLSEKGVQIIEKDVKIIKKSNAWVIVGDIFVSDPAVSLKQVENSQVTEVIERN